MNRSFSENVCKNLRLRIFTDPSGEAMCVVAYLHDVKTLQLTYLIDKRCIQPIKHMKIPKLEIQAAVYEARLKKQILREHDAKIDKN